MTVILEPRSQRISTAIVEGLLVSHAYRTDGDTRLAGHAQIVVKKHLVEFREVSPVTTIGPVQGNDDDGIGVRTVFANVGYPLLDIGAESLDIGAGQTTLFLQDDVRPCLVANEHLSTGSAVAQSVAFVPMGTQRLAQHGVFEPPGILAHGLCDVVEHGSLVVVVDETVVQGQHLHLFRELGNQCDVSRHQRY